MITNEQKIIIYLLENKVQDHNILQISKKLKIEYKNLYQSIKRLEKKGTLQLKPFGRSLKVLLQDKISPEIYEAEYHRKKEFLKNKDLKVLTETFERGLKTKLYMLILFGSHVKKTSTKHSDIDLCFIVPDESTKTEQTIFNISSTIPLKLHVNIFKESEFLNMKYSKIPTVGTEILKHNIILQGIENYYNLIQ